MRICVYCASIETIPARYPDLAAPSAGGSPPVAGSWCPAAGADR
jgi:hypothetical protein